MSDNDNYATHAVSLLDSAQSLKCDGVLFDFIVKIEDESFQTHRFVLAAYSEYFRAMFNHDTKELQEGEIEMKDVRAHAMKECLDFMYTSEFSVNMDTVEDLLKLADMLQLPKVKETCMDCLSDNLDVSNCIYVLKLLEIFPNETLREKCIEFGESSIDDVVVSADFKQLSLPDVKKYLVECNSNVDSIWNATVSWIEHDEDYRAKEVLEFVNLLLSHGFPSSSVLKEMWSKAWFSDFADARDTVVQNLFSDIGRLESNLSGCSCSFLKKLADSYEHVTKEAKNVILSSLKQNLDQVMGSDEFFQYSKDDVSLLLSSEDAEYLTPESAKWNAVIKWLKHNDGNDDIFPCLLRSIKFDLLSLDFINTVVRKEPLVKKFDDNNEILFNKIGSHKKALKKFLVVLYKGGSVKEWKLATNTWKNLPTFSPWFRSEGPNQVINLNNNVCLLSGCNLFHLLKSGKWIEKARVGHTVACDAKVVVCDGYLYIVEQECLSRYNSEKDKWIENLSHCPIKPMYVTASEKHIYSSSSQESNIVWYEPCTDLWTEFCPSPNIQYADILFANFNLLTLGYSNLALYDVENKKWILKKVCHEINTAQLDFFDINGDVAAFGMDNEQEFLAIYIESYDNWMKIISQSQSSNTGAYSFGSSSMSQHGGFGSQSKSKLSSVGQFGLGGISSGLGAFGTDALRLSNTRPFSFGSSSMSQHGVFGSQSNLTFAPAEEYSDEEVYEEEEDEEGFLSPQKSTQLRVSACAFMKCRTVNG